MLCSRDLAIAISAATIYHEIAQEVADYFMLTKFCHIPPIKALCINFLNGLSVLFGALLIVGIDNITNVAVGSILGVSGGVYIYIAVAECFPRAKQAQETLKDKLMSLLAFIIGVIPIGLVLISHGHCEA
jgi:zinc transporter ZupT